VLINQLAKVAGLSKDGIRHYEEIGLITSSPRRAGSRVYRDYDPSALKIIEHVRQAQRLGLTLREIRDLLETYGAQPPSKKQTIAFLEERLVAVLEQRNSLRDVERFIRKKLKCYRDQDSAE
jgi:MerR family transcriptional regulator, copper efflux regulator